MAEHDAHGELPVLRITSDGTDLLVASSSARGGIADATVSALVDRVRSITRWNTAQVLHLIGCTDGSRQATPAHMAAATRNLEALLALLADCLEVTERTDLIDESFHRVGIDGALPTMATATALQIHDAVMAALEDQVVPASSGAPDGLRSASIAASRHFAS